MLELLQGPLAPLLRSWTVAELPLDLQLREGDGAQLYCGLTSLLVAKPRHNGYELTAHGTYARQACAKPLLRVWTRSEPGLEHALAEYLRCVRVARRHTGREGRVQADWMSIRSPWIPIDREGVLGYASTPERALALECPAVRRAWDASHMLCARNKWASLKPLGGSNEVDQVAVAPNGDVVLVELKYGAAADVYQAPVQALRYVWEWHAALGTIVPGLRSLVAARTRLGLSPADTPDPAPRLRWALAVGRNRPSKEVRRRLDAIRALVADYRPQRLPMLELWALDERGYPERIG